MIDTILGYVIVGSVVAHLAFGVFLLIAMTYKEFFER